jgi:RND family efflux transporter MFP subunit
MGYYMPWNSGRWVCRSFGFSWCFLLCVLGFLGAGCNRQKPQQTKKDSGPIDVQIAEVSTRHIQRVVESVGTLYPFDEVIVSAEVDGRADQVNFDLGDQVKPGDVLVHISEEEQRYVVAQNEAQLRQSLERLGLKNENDKVTNIEETPEVRRARADLLEAQQRHRRQRDLTDQGIGAQADFDQTVARLQAMQAAYDATLNQTRNLIQEVERFKAILEQQRKRLRDTSVRAPFAGAVKERQVTMGQYVRANTPLFALVKINPVRLRLEVPERMAPWVKESQNVDVWVEAFADHRFTGRVSRISPTVDQSKRTFIVEALIDNPEGALKPGSYARARLVTQKTDEVRLVPASAVNYVLGTNKTYLVKGDTIEARDVKIGDRFEGEIEILEGLQGGEQVAASQLNRLDTGTKVRVRRNSERHANGVTSTKPSQQ